MTISGGIGTTAIFLMRLGHTDSDLVVSIPDAGVVFAGDLLEQGAPPYYGDGYPFAWQDTVNDLRIRESRVTVPGHGDLMDAAAVATQCDEIAAVAEVCAAGLATALFDASQGPYPAETMRDAWERAKLEHGLGG